MKNENEVIEYIKNHYIYDAATGEIRNRKGQVVKGYDRNGYKGLNIRVRNRRNVVGLHRIVWTLVNGRMPKQIDHINGDPKDNRIENLREVSQSENDENRVWTWKMGKGKIPGVCRSRRGYRFRMGKKDFGYTDAHACFHDLSLLGRMYRDDDESTQK